MSGLTPAYKRRAPIHEWDPPEVKRRKFRGTLYALKEQINRRQERKQAAEEEERRKSRHGAPPPRVVESQRAAEYEAMIDRVRDNLRRMSASEQKQYIRENWDWLQKIWPL